MRAERSFKLRVGILGGGQLARMLALSAHPLGVEPWILSESQGDPAAQVSSYWMKGKISSRSDLQRFLGKVDVATFESEFLDAKLLQSLSAQTRTPVYPHPTIIETLQDRWTQKRLLTKWSIPTAPFVKVTSRRSAERAYQELGEKMVLKQRRMGYDGYGTFVVDSLKELSAIPWERSSQHGWIAESWIPFEHEWAILMVRNTKGNTVELPLVKTFQKDSRCLWVAGPAKPPRSFEKIRGKLKVLLSKIQYVGVIAFELFSRKGEFLVNEIAPRVHNSGHYSLDALSTSQFEYHLRAILDAELPNPLCLSKGFAMMNLLGEEKSVDLRPWPAQAHLHWYGKSENRPGRKMGHYTVLGRSPQTALKEALRLRRRFVV